MSTSTERKVRRDSQWMTRCWAVVKYELLWNIRKKKILGVVAIAFALATLSFLLPVILSRMASRPLNPNPDYVVSIGVGIGGLGFFLFAVVTAMNSISGEFESGTIVTLLTKPVSRTMVFLSKMFAAFITLLLAYTVLFVYTAVGGAIVYGPQNNLHLIVLTLLGSILSTFVWAAITFALGSLSKSSLIAALGTFGIFIALTISHPIISIFSNQAWVLNYIPGNGITGLIQDLGRSISSGTDNLAANLLTYVLHPASEVTFYKIDALNLGPSSSIELYTEPLSLVMLRSMTVAVVYIVVFSLLAWYALKRAQIVE